MSKRLDDLIARARRRRALRLTGIIADLIRTKGGCRIVDLGGEASYWRGFDLDAFRTSRVKITLVNPQPEPVDDPLFTAVTADACDLRMFADGAFDLAHSNSTLEHVGEWSRMRAFAAELRRLAPSYYVQTPYVWFPIEPHFLALGFHWAPEAVRVRALMRRRFGHHARAESVDEAMETVRSARLLDRTQFAALFPDARHETEQFAGLAKSLIALRLERP